MSKKVSIKYYHEPTKEELDYDSKMLEQFNNNKKEEPKKQPKLTEEEIKHNNNLAYLEALERKYLSQ